MPKTETEMNHEDIETDNEMLEEIYYIEFITYEYKNIHVEYPVIRGLTDKGREEEINKLIENRILLDIIQTDDIDRLNELNMVFECRITLQSQELLSFCNIGESFIDGFKPFNDFYAMTIDIINAKELELSDFIEIDETLVERIKNSTDVTNQFVESGMDKKYLLLEIQDKDDESLIEDLTRGWYGVVLEPDVIVVGVNVTYASGVYALIKLPGRIVDNRFQFEKDVE